MELSEMQARAAELERLYNHVGDIGNLCAGAGFSFGISQGSRLKEELQRLQKQPVWTSPWKKNWHCRKR